ncbi:hypothetical protein [Afipia sp. GAS231]|uniref:hypothetical protein n=1 Tax=Afipia sp. GAS231 TaxID=1882747 RepID=UPI00087D50AB|nr:hypothetical protein [Afipia sp. GAS231]SDN40264.1 hypothetical protein SAMN05444050_1481 [Afipia sp. GAS231]
MTNGIRRIALSPSGEDPFNKLVPSQSAIRSVNARVLIERLPKSVTGMFLPIDAAGIGVSAEVPQRTSIACISEREVG